MSGHSPGNSSTLEGKDRPASSQYEPKPAVVVPLDGSDQALVALPVAKTLARIEAATLHILHVHEPVSPPREVLGELGIAVEQLRGSVVDQATGPPAAGIAHLARQLGSLYIVMSTHTGSDPSEDEVGLVARDVLGLAPCPVVLVRPERGVKPWALNRILVPHDGTPTTAAALEPAASLALHAGAELEVLHVAVAEDGRPVEPGTFAAPRYMDQPQHEWPAWASEFIERLRGLGHSPASLKMRLFLGRGQPGEEIVRFANEHDVDLVVLGWRGVFEAERATHVKCVIRNVLCPVLIKRVEG